VETVTKAWYGLTIDNALLKKKEQEYEDLFCDVMEKKHGTDFQRVKAAGSEGDAKSDGFLFSEKWIFQSYAPSSGFKKSKLLRKIEDDFEGAKKRWGDNMRKWAFVHNEQEGLPPYAHFKIIDIGKLNSKIDIHPSIQPSHLKSWALSLAKEHLVDLFGPAPTNLDVTQLTHGPVKYLLRAMHKKGLPARKIEPVSVNKLEFNQLSDDVAALLSVGRRKEKLVEDLLSTWPDPIYGDELSGAFIDKYKELLDDELEPDQIFMELKVFAGGNSNIVSEQVSSLALLSYFFERCDIFENPPKGWQP
jgi:hypothetical protein